MRASEPLAGAVALLLGLAGPGWADEASNEALRLRYAAPQTCPDRNAFLGLLRRRTSRARLVADDQRARELDIVVRLEPSRAFGRLLVREPGGRTANRELDAATCAELVDGLALIVALAIDPNASTAPLPPMPPEAIALEPAPRQQPPPAPRARTRMVWSSGALFEVRDGVSPDLLPVAAAFIDTRFDRASSLSPSFRLSARAGLATVGTPVGDASFRWAIGALEVCPLRWKLSRHFAASPCSSFEAGLLRVAGRIPGGRADAAPWLGAAVDARIQWLAGARLFFELDGGVHLPLLQHDVTFLGGSVSVYEVPVAAAKGAFGIGVQFE